MLPDFESKIVSCLPADKQRDGPTLFPLLEQCFQEVGLTEWKNVVSAHRLDEYAKMFKNSLNASEIISRHLPGSRTWVNR